MYIISFVGDRLFLVFSASTLFFLMLLSVVGFV